MSIATVETTAIAACGDTLTAKALRTVNRQIMHWNELALARSNSMVDFDSVGTTAERMDRMLSALSEGLRVLGFDVSAAGLGVLPFADDLGVHHPALLFYSVQLRTARSRYGRRYPLPYHARYQSSLSDTQVLNTLADHLSAIASNADVPIPRSIIAAPYFVRKWNGAGSGFEIEKLIFSRFYFCDSLNCPTWKWLSEDIKPTQFIQRLVLF